MAEKGFYTIPMTDDSPEVTFDDENWIIKISGPSFPEDPVVFYNQIIHWIDSNERRFSKITLIFDYTILSSSSNKMVFEIFLKLEELIAKGKEVEVQWYYEKYDEDMMDEGRGFLTSMKVPVKLIEK